MSKRKLANLYLESHVVVRRVSEVIAGIRDGRNTWLADIPVDAFVYAGDSEQMKAFLKEATEFIITRNDGMRAEGRVCIRDIESFREKCLKHGVDGSTNGYVMYNDTLPDGRLYVARSRIFSTNLTAADIPESYCHLKGYKKPGYLRTDGISKLVYHPSPFHNHSFKDDFLYIFYDGDIEGAEVVTDSRGLATKYDECVFGNDIIAVIRHIDRYSPEIDTEEIREKMVQQYNDFVDEVGHRYGSKKVSSFEEL